MNPIKCILHQKYDKIHLFFVQNHKLCYNLYRNKEILICAYTRVSIFLLTKGTSDYEYCFKPHSGDSQKSGALQMAWMGTIDIIVSVINEH